MTTKDLIDLLEIKRREFVLNEYIPKLWILELSKEDFDSVQKDENEVVFIKETTDEIKKERRELADKLGINENDWFVYRIMGINYMIICRTK